MTIEPAPSWTEANQNYMALSLAIVHSLLERRSEAESHEISLEYDDREMQNKLEEATNQMQSPPALELLCNRFGLSKFERNLLLMCAGMELDSTFAPLFALAQGNSQRSYPTFSLALATLPDAHWSALAPSSPLRYWRIIELIAGDVLTLRPLKIDERILHYLVGVNHLDERLAGIIEPQQTVDHEVPYCRSLGEQIAATWSNADGKWPLPVLQIYGKEPLSNKSVASLACKTLGLNLNIINASSLPMISSDLIVLIRLCEREAALGTSTLYLDCYDDDPTDATCKKSIFLFAETIRCPLIISGRAPQMGLRRDTVSFEVTMPTSSEQRMIWEMFLGPIASELNGQIDLLASQFNLSAPVIQSICKKVDAMLRDRSTSSALNDIKDALWDACRSQTSSPLDELAQKMKSTASWEDLVLPNPQIQLLHDIALQVRQRDRVYREWGFGEKFSRGLGISVLFAGPSGTGKTMAAEVLANELLLDLYRIDLSSVVSKYIGETEKNLRKVFDAAEGGGSILLFDEADALFGRRSEVKDSHDRYANIEVSFLLQRMESYRGLAILTTNMKSALDSAFLRRIRFVVQFPFPDEKQRVEIWKRIFPEALPTDGLNVNKLARLNVAGGSIRNIALNAAFLAAEAKEPVKMAHLLKAARVEYAKMEKSLTDAETGGWA